MKTVALVGSLRKDSYNLQLIEHLQERFPELNIEAADISQLPFFNEEIEADPGKLVQGFQTAIKEADAVIIATPEYNASIPAVLKNAIDWVSRAGKELAGKKVMIMGASMGVLGTVKAQIHLRHILDTNGVAAHVMPSAGGNDVFLGSAHTKFDENRKLIDKGTVQFIDGVINRFKKFLVLDLNL